MIHRASASGGCISADLSAILRRIWVSNEGDVPKAEGAGKVSKGMFVRLTRRMAPVALLLGASAALASIPTQARAFCGFYVGGAEAELYNNATLVVLMRDGTRTVLSMRNHYQGPAENFAMVVPVPVVLSEDDVHTLDASIFDKIDRLAAPRLVEYWEQDPCAPVPEYDMLPMASSVGRGGGGTETEGAGDLGVQVEAEFAVGEYDIVILSAQDSSGLDTWLRREGYRIPENAEPVLRPYVAAGTKFFVARVDVSRVTNFQNGQAMLSPLRVSYESSEFSLPIRLGLVNSQGAQDLLVHILARGQRYEVANYRNVMIPTNIRVNESVLDNFGPFYAALFDRVVEQNPNAVVTEYSWDSSSCDPCPGPTLTPADLMTLGVDVIGGPPGGFVLTRLHHRYTNESLGEDLTFRAAAPIVGGRGMPDESGRLPRENTATSINNFQGRYAVLHRWEGELSCDSPTRGRWGGPPNAGQPQPRAATNLAFVERGRPLGGYLAEDLEELGVRQGSAESSTEPGPASGGSASSSSPTNASAGGGCASCAVTGSQRTMPASVLFALGLVVAIGVWRRRRA